MSKKAYYKKNEDIILNRAKEHYKNNKDFILKYGVLRLNPGA